MKKIALILSLMALSALAGEKILNPYWFQNDQKEYIQKKIIDNKDKNYTNPYWFQK